MTPPPDPTRPGPATPAHRVTGGGPPTDAQAAAIAAALTELGREDAATSAEVARHEQVPAWTAAMLTEGVTRTIISAPRDLPDHHRGVGT